MKLYLVQHGEAKSKDEDEKRPLTDQGRQGVERVAAFLKGAGVETKRVIHSGKLRAEQTAEILANLAPSPRRRAGGQTTLSSRATSPTCRGWYRC